MQQILEFHRDVQSDAVQGAVQAYGSCRIFEVALNWAGIIANLLIQVVTGVAGQAGRGVASASLAKITADEAGELLCGRTGVGKLAIVPGIVATRAWVYASEVVIVGRSVRIAEGAIIR